MVNAEDHAAHCWMETATIMVKSNSGASCRACSEHNVCVESRPFWGGTRLRPQGDSDSDEFSSTCEEHLISGHGRAHIHGRIVDFLKPALVRQLTAYTAVPPRLVKGMPAWSVKTRHAPSWHCNDARTYDYTTTAMHDMGAPPLLRL